MSQEDLLKLSDRDLKNTLEDLTTMHVWEEGEPDRKVFKKDTPRYWIVHDVLEKGKMLTPEERQEVIGKYTKKDKKETTGRKRVSHMILTLRKERLYMHEYAREEKKLFVKKPFQKEQNVEGLPKTSTKTSQKTPVDPSEETSLKTSTTSAEVKEEVTQEALAELSDRDLLVTMHNRLNQMEGNMKMLEAVKPQEGDGGEIGKEEPKLYTAEDVRKMLIEMNSVHLKGRRGKYWSISLLGAVLAC